MSEIKKTDSINDMMELLCYDFLLRQQQRCRDKIAERELKIRQLEAILKTRQDDEMQRSVVDHKTAINVMQRKIDNIERKKKQYENDVIKELIPDLC